MLRLRGVLVTALGICLVAWPWTTFAQQETVAEKTSLRRELKGKRSSRKESGKSGKSSGRSKKLKKSEKSKSGSKSRSRKSRESKKSFLERISLANFRPEGISNGPGSAVFASQVLWGGVVKVNVRTAERSQVVPIQESVLQRCACGIDYYARGHDDEDGAALIVAGGGPAVVNIPTSEFYIYDVETGEELAICQPQDGSGWINDVAIVGNKAYLTDSNLPTLTVLDVSRAIDSGECVIESIPLGDAFKSSNPGEFRGNGIAPYANGFVIGNTHLGAAFFLDLSDNSVTQIVDSDVIPGADGIEVLDDKLYITSNQLNEIGVWELSGGSGGNPVTASAVGSLRTPLFQSPTASAVKGGYIYSVNSRFFGENAVPFPDPNEGNLEEFDEEFDMVGTVNFFDDTRHCIA